MRLTALSGLASLSQTAFATAAQVIGAALEFQRHYSILLFQQNNLQAHSLKSLLFALHLVCDVPKTVVCNFFKPTVLSNIVIQSTKLVAMTSSAIETFQFSFDTISLAFDIFEVLFVSFPPNLNPDQTYTKEWNNV